MIDDVSMPVEALREPPHILWTHVDGPYLTWAGNGHWLTWRERFALWCGRTDIEAITQKHWPWRQLWTGKVNFDI
jgi:hypothetical protein